MKPFLRALAIGVATLLASCGSADTFTVQVRLVSIDTSFVNRLRVSIRAQDGGRFEPQAERTYEGGAIVARVADDGALDVEVSGDHVRANATAGSDGQPRYALEIETDNPAMLEAPRIEGFVTNGVTFIAQGGGYLDRWPPPSGSEVQLDVACTSRCRP